MSAGLEGAAVWAEATVLIARQANPLRTMFDLFIAILLFINLRWSGAAGRAGGCRQENFFG
jgi:hypothetical protein